MKLPPALRAKLLPVVLLSGVVTFAWSVHGHYPLSQWLFFRYLSYWVVCSLFAAASLSAGFRCVSLLVGQQLRFTERLVLGFAAGVLGFGLGVFVAGLLGGLGPVFFVAWPLLLLAWGGKRTLQRIWHGIRRLVAGGRSVAGSAPRSPSLGERARLVLLGLGLVAVYTQVMTPANVSFDARWYHLPLAEQYALEGTIRRFADGWYLAAYPQLASWLYTWAFLLPSSLFDHVMLSAHLEWTLFLATVASIGPLLRRLLPGARMRWAGALFFLFPSVLLYDSNLNSGADHVLAFWAAPLAIALCACRRAPTLRSVALVAVVGAGAILTKYQALYLIVPASVGMLWLLARAGRLALLAPGAALLLLLTAPHWLKNALYYGDPFYPILSGYLPAEPFHSGARLAMEQNYVPTRFVLEGSLLHKCKETAKTLLTFAFVPHNWKHFRIPEPTFGSLFTLLTPTLLLVSHVRRTALLMAGTYAGIAIWFWTNHQDRFLQALLPWMVGAVAVLCMLLWRAGRVAQLSLVGLVAFQVVWGADMFFYSTHRMIKAPVISALATFLSAANEGKRRTRLDAWGEMKRVGAALPQGATLLLHDRMLRLGLGRSAVTDHFGFQGALSYLALPSTRKVWEAWRSLGADYVVWSPIEERETQETEKLARQLAFFDAVGAATESVESLGSLSIAQISTQAPRESARWVRILGCAGSPAPGTYALASRAVELEQVSPVAQEGSLSPSPFHPGSPASSEDVTLVAVRTPCPLTASQITELRAAYRRIATIPGYVLWARKRVLHAAQAGE